VGGLCVRRGGGGVGSGGKVKVPASVRSGCACLSRADGRTGG